MQQIADINSASFPSRSLSCSGSVEATLGESGCKVYLFSNNVRIKRNCEFSIFFYKLYKPVQPHKDVRTAVTKLLVFIDGKTYYGKKGGLFLVTSH